MIKPALLIYAFAVVDGGARAHRSWQELDELWRACRAWGPVSAPLLGIDAPDRLPEPRTADGEFRIMASARRATPGRVRSMFAFTEHGIAGLVAALSADQDGANGGEELAARWRDEVLAPSGENLMCTFVLTVLAADEDSRLDAAGDMAACFGIDLKRTVSDSGPSRSLLWSAKGDQGRRMFIVSAPEADEDGLDEWVWASDGRQGLVALTRYCLNVFRLSHQRRVYNGLQPVSEVVAENDAAARNLSAHLDGASSPETPSAALVTADMRLRRAQVGSMGVLWRQTKIQDMAVGVQAARANLTRHRPAPEMMSGGVFAHDDAEAAWFADRLDREVEYLEAVVRRSESVHDVAGTVIGIATARRRERITLLQTSFLGALLMALAAIQSFQFTTPLAQPVKGPMIAALAAAAFGLPILVARWGGLVSDDDRYRWADLFAAAVFGGALAWLAGTVVWMTVAGHLAPALITGITVSTGALLALCTTWCIGRRRARHA